MRKKPGGFLAARERAGQVFLLAAWNLRLVAFRERCQRGGAEGSRAGGGVACLSASTPPGTALSDFARRKPSEIPSRTQSVSVFLPGKVSMGAPFLRRIPLQGSPTRRRVFN